MKTLAIIARMIIGLIIAVPVAWVASAIIYEKWNTYSYRYRLTLEVETPAGVQSAGSVIEVSIREKATWVPQTGGVSRSVRGEAVFVDLGDGRHVIGTLGFGPHGQEHKIEWIATEVLGPLHGSPQARARGGTYREASSWTGRADLPPQLIPTLVTFADLNDPTTARVVQPAELEQVFGPGVRFKRAWIEMTRDPVTRGIEQKLPWWDRPLPWLKPIGGGVAVDTRTTLFKLNKEHFKGAM